MIITKSDFSLMKELKIDEKIKNFLNIEKNNNSIIILDGTLFFSYKNYLNLLDSLKVFYKTNYTMSVSDLKKYKYNKKICCSIIRIFR